MRRSSDISREDAGGAHLDGYIELVKDILVGSGFPDAVIYVKEPRREGVRRYLIR